LVFIFFGLAKRRLRCPNAGALGRPAQLAGLYEPVA
jgi:hypothetical protein